MKEEKRNSSWEKNSDFISIVKRWHSRTEMSRLSRKVSVNQKLYHVDVDVCNISALDLEGTTLPLLK